ncbi:MAG: hypothetical protein M1832_002069 [Thelocarpon impressellum]|nr:MAG: hypothetical protein M1832_002069 [Thelocarpon impressellum]
MSTPVHELPRPQYPGQAGQANRPTTRGSSEEGTFVGEGSFHESNGNGRTHLTVEDEKDELVRSQLSPSGTREQSSRLDDDLEMLRAELAVDNETREKDENGLAHSKSARRTRSRRSEPEDAFDVSTNPIHERTNGYSPPENPTTKFAKFFKRVHESSFLVRYFTYITPLVALILIPLLLGLLVFPNASVGGVSLFWFSIWLEIVWLTLWAGRIVAKCLPWPLGVVSSAFTNNSKKWRDMGKQLEVPATLFFWWLAIEVSFLPTMTNNHVFDKNVKDQKATKPWENSMNKVIVAIFAGTVLNFFEKIVIQLIAISFHLRTYSDRIDVNKFQIASLAKLYAYSKDKIAMDDSEFENQQAPGSSGTQTPMQYLNKAQKNAREALGTVADAAGIVAGDFTGKQVVKRTHPNQVVLTLLHTTNGSQVLARRLYRTFAREASETVFQDDLRVAFESDDEADAAFQMFDKDLNGDISMEELEAVCVEIGRERKSITASLKDLDSVVSKLDNVLLFFVVVITVLIFLSLVSESTAAVLTSAGSTLLALSWLFAATAQEFLQSVIFVFVKHPFDVGDRVSIYGNTGAQGKGDDYFVKEIALLYTEFKKMEGQVVQAPNSYLNTLFILNMRRSGGLAEGVPVVIKFGTTLEQIDALRQRLLEFVLEEKREYQGKILTELREVKEAYSITLNVVFFYKSNWQNELLRLQRRNKFICALMVTMQDLGFEGPLMRLPGTKESAPMFLHQLVPGQSGLSAGGSDPSGGTDNQGGPVQGSSGILRNGQENGGRGRGESMSTLSKRVDFSLGMRGQASGDMMSDLYDDRSRSRLPKNFNAASASRSRSNISEDDNALAHTSSADTTGVAGRTSSESQSRHRGTHSIHRPRFLSRHRNATADDGDLESGAVMADIPEASGPNSRAASRTNTLSPQSMQAPQAQFPAAGAPGQMRGPQRANTESVEMSRMRSNTEASPRY